MQDIIVVGASAGGVETLASLVRELPAHLPAALFIVVHFPPQGTSVLPHILNRAGNLPAHHATDGEAVRHGHIYIAPPDWHMVLDKENVRLTRGPTENRNRPAIDPLFRSAALHYGQRVAGVLLSGSLDDGTAGMHAIKARGGVTICQEPAEATYPDMPRNAIESVGVNLVLRVKDIAVMLNQLSHEPSGEESHSAHQAVARLQRETEIAALEWKALTADEPPGESSVLACPTCGGVLWERQDGQMLHFRCRVGHAFSPNELLDSQGSQVESALWTAFRALEERVALLERMISRARAYQHPRSVEHLELQKQESKQRAALLHEVLKSGGLAALAGAATHPAISGQEREQPVVTDQGKGADDYG